MMKKDTRKSYKVAIKNKHYFTGTRSCANVKANSLEEAERVAKVLFRPLYCETVFVSENN